MDDSNINLNKSNDVLILKCEKCGKSFGFDTIIGFIRDTILNCTKITPGNVKAHKLLRELMLKIAAEISVEFLLFSLGFSKDEYHIFRQYYSCNYNTAKDLVFIEKIDDILDGWEEMNDRRIDALDKHDQKAQLVFFCKKALETWEIKKENKKQFVQRLIYVYKIQDKYMPITKEFVTSMIIQFISLLDKESNKNVIRILNKLVESVDDMRNQAVAFIYSRLVPDEKEIRTFELKLLHEVFEQETDNKGVIDETCKKYFSSKEFTVHFMKRFISKVNRMVVRSGSRIRPINRLYWMVSAFLKHFSSKKPTLTDIANFLEIIKSNAHLKCLLPEIMALLHRVLREKDLLDAISHVDSENLDNKICVYNEIFNTSENKRGRPNTEIFFSSLSKTKNEISKLTIITGMFTVRRINPTEHPFFADLMAASPSPLYCEYTSGYAIALIYKIEAYFKKQESRGPADLPDKNDLLMKTEIEEHFYAYQKCFLHFTSHLSGVYAFDITTLSTFQSLLYGLNAYLCTQYLPRFPQIEQTWYLPLLVKGKVYSKMINDIIFVRNNTRGLWISGLMNRVLEFCLRDELSKNIENVFIRSRVFCIVERVTSYLIHSHTPLTAIYRVNLLRIDAYSIFAIFQYYKEMCRTCFGKGFKEALNFSSYSLKRLKIIKRGLACTLLGHFNRFSEAYMQDLSGLRSVNDFRRHIFKFVTIEPTAQFYFALDVLNNVHRNRLNSILKTIFTEYAIKTKGRPVAAPELTNEECIVMFEELFPVEDVLNRDKLMAYQ